MGKYKCIKAFSVDRYDEDCMYMEGKSYYIRKGSIWEMPSEEDIKEIKDFLEKVDTDYIEYNEKWIIPDIVKIKIENILAEYQRVKEENEEYKKQLDLGCADIDEAIKNARETIAKANKYDALVEKAKRLLDYAENYAEKGEFNNGYCQAINNVLKEEV